MEKKVAVVTGASRGIGAAIAKRAGSSGLYVVINYCGSEEKAQEIKTEIEQNGGEALYINVMFLTTWHVKNLLEM